MPADDGWRAPEGAQAMSAPQTALSDRPQLSLADIIVLLWRAKWAIALIAAPIFVLGIVAAFTLPVKYESYSRVQVSVGSERIFNPIVGPGQGAVLEQQAITESEIELLQSPVIHDRVLQKLGIETVYPKMAKAMAKASPDERPILYERAVAAMQKDFAAGAAPKNPVIRTTYSNEDAIVAANVLNTIIATYLEYRAELFLDDDETALVGQRNASDAKLAAADQAIEDFLTKNRIGDFDTERSSVAGLYGRVTDELFEVQASQSEVNGRLASLNAQLALTEPTIDLFTESNTERQLIDLQIQREQLLATYRPGTPEIDAIDRRIENVESLLASTSVNGGGLRRRGPNLVYQELETQRAQLEAESKAQKERLAELRRQKKEVESRQMTLTRLEPRYQELLRERAILENQVRSLTIRGEEERLKREVSKTEFDNIQILEPARPASQGSSLRKPVAAIGLLFGGFTGLVFALMWAFTRTTLTTAKSAERTIGLPVLASVPPIRGGIS